MEERQGDSKEEEVTAIAPETSGEIHDGVTRVLPVPVCSEIKGNRYLGDGAVCVKLVKYTEEQVARGVFALKRIERGMLVEVAHCIEVPKVEYQEHIKHTVFEHYVFKSKKTGGCLLCLGLGSLFNHNESPCLDYRIDEDNLLIRFYAAKAIEPGDELTIFYGANLWFEDPTSTELSTSPPETEESFFSKLCIGDD